MLLTPRYDDRPIIEVDIRAGVHPVMRQRRRLERLLTELSDDEWEHPSRCEDWTVHDVVTHLVGTNAFWAMSIRAGLAGEPTRFMAAFDPVATPAAMVADGQGDPPAETLAQLIASNDDLAGLVDGLVDDDWDKLGEAPPGHVPIHLVADHALWDAWVHERDIVLPLDRRPVVDSDEVLVSLRYCAALGRAMMVSVGSTEQGAIELVVQDPADRLVVEVDGDVVRVHDGESPAGTPVVEADAVALVEMLSLRDDDLSRPAGLAWLTAGLAEAFDQPQPR